MAGFDEACRALEKTLTGPARAEIARGHTVRGLRELLRGHALAPFAPQLDRLTRADGFHALHDWDGKADGVNPEIIPVDVLDWVSAAASPGERARAILLDYYFLHVLSLLALRLWDAGDADANLERLDRLLDALQGPDGSGHLFVDNAATLILVATAHFELEERGYAALLERVRALNEDHRCAIALDHAGAIGCHLRFGFEATYRRDVILMRNDNVADYPWLAFAVGTLIDEYQRRPDPRTAEGILNGLSPDAGLFITGADGDRLRALREALLETFETLRPREGVYSPLSLFFNFSHNVVKGTVVDAVLSGEPWDVTLNDLLTAIPEEADEGPRGSLARTLMAYARSRPDRVAGQPRPAIVYDPGAGRQAFGIALAKLKHGK